MNQEPPKRARFDEALALADKEGSARPPALQNPSAAASTSLQRYFNLPHQGNFEQPLWSETTHHQVSQKRLALAQEHYNLALDKIRMVQENIQVEMSMVRFAAFNLCVVE